MKQIFYIVTLALGLISCNNQTAQQNVATNGNDTLQSASIDDQRRHIFIKDKSQYDETFIEGLEEYKEPIKLIDNYILTSTDTTYFPEDLKLNERIIFKGIKDGNQFLLTVTRTNLTNLNYEFEIVTKDNKITDKKSGKAVLGSMFFLASEVDEDDLTGMAYGSSEYRDKTDNCNLSIRVGIGLDDNGKQRAIVTYYCEDNKQQTLNIEDCPTLRTG